MLRISSELTRDRFYLHLTLDVSVRNRNGRFIFSKYCTMSGTRHTARGNPIYVQANAASRHAVSICQSTWFYCPPQWLLTKSYFSFSIPFESLSLSSSLLFFVICTPNRAELLQNGSGSGGGSVCRQQKISNKSFRNPASLLSASPDFHYSLLCHLRILPKLFLFPLASPYRPVKRENYYIVSIFLPLVAFSRLALSYFYLFFFSSFISSFFVAFWQTRALVPFLLFFCIFFLYIPSSISRNLSSGQRFNRVCFVCFPCVNLNSNFLAIQAYRHYDIWRRGLRLKEGFVRVSKLRSSQSRAPTGIGRHAKRRTRQRDLLKQREQRDFLSYLSSFFWRNRERSTLFHRMCRPSFGIFIALLLHHRAYSRSDRIIVRLSYVARCLGFLSP